MEEDVDKILKEFTSQYPEFEKLFKFSQNDLVKKFFEKEKLNKPIEFLGCGAKGCAYLTDNNLVVKFTTDRSEIIESNKIKGKKLKYLSNIYETFILGGKYKGVYVIIGEYLENVGSINFFALMNVLYSSNIGIGTILQGIILKGIKSVEKEINKINDIINDDESEQGDENSILFQDLINIANEMHQHGIKSYDIHQGNLGYKKDGTLSLFDLGFGQNKNKKMIAKAKQVDIYEKKEIGEDIETSTQPDFDVTASAGIMTDMSFNNRPSLVKEGKSTRTYETFKINEKSTIDENSDFGVEVYNKWKRKNVTLRGMKVKGEPNNVSGSLGKGLYTVPLSNKTMAKGYGKLYFVVNGRPKNPKKFNDLNQWEIWFYNKIVMKYSKDEFPDIREFNKHSTIEKELLNLGFDGIEIIGREIVNFKPENLIYFESEEELKNYFSSQKL